MFPSSKRIFLLFLSFLLACCAGRDVLNQERKYVSDVMQNHPDIVHKYLNAQGHQLHYASSGDSSKPALIIIHGTPGDWQQYARYMLNAELLASFRVVVIDRPGWGESILKGNRQVADFSLQSKIISALLKKLREESNNQPVVIMGHSLGASLAPQIAIDYPELVQGLLLFAGTLDPQLSSPRWFNYVGKAFPVSAMLGENLRKSNQEIFDLKNNVTAMAKDWGLIKAHVIAVQGMNDGLVYPKNSFYIEQNFNPARTKVIRLANEGHLFPMTLRDEVVDWAKDILHDIKNAQ